MVHLEFCVKLIHRQLDRGKKFIFEHPWSAWSWYLEALTSVMARAGVMLVKGDQCPFGQTAVDRDGHDGLVQKGSGWLTNSAAVAGRVGVLCDNWYFAEEDKHRHVQLVNGRAKGAERYPLALIWALLKGMREDLVERRISGSMEAGLHVDEPEAVEGYAGVEEVTDVVDRISGASLKGALVAKARQEEMDYMRKLKVFKHEPVSACWAITGAAPLPVDWVDVNKGDDKKVEIRSSLVVQETKRKTTIAPDDIAATFAATPPIEALRFLFSLGMSSWAVSADEMLVFIFIDISRAHLRSDLIRGVFVDAPKEDSECPVGYVWRLLKAMYGLKDAGNAFDRTCERLMVKELDFTQGLFSPCLYWHKQLQVWVFRHGDDFVGLGTRRQCRVFAELLGKRLIVKVCGILGPDPASGDVQEIVILNRIVRWVRDASGADRLEMEPDPRHVQILRHAMGLKENSKGVSFPGTKVTGAWMDGRELEKGEIVEFRSSAMRGAYLAQDRPEIQFAAKEIARLMPRPVDIGLQMLKHIGRFQAANPRTVLVYRHQVPVAALDVYSDSNHAGCTQTRKSTSCTDAWQTLAEVIVNDSDCVGHEQRRE